MRHQYSAFVCALPLALALTACHRSPACTVSSTALSAPPGHALARSPACLASDATTYRWVRSDGTFGQPGAEGLNLMPGEQVPYAVAAGNGAHAEYAVNGGDWARVEEGNTTR